MKLKNIIKIMATALLIAAICAPENMVYGENLSANNEELACRKIIDAFNEEDVQNEFLNYTENTYSYSAGNELLRMVTDESEVYTGTVIGAVYDNSTGNYLPNMWVYFEELDYCVVTGEEGRFEITGIPDGYLFVGNFKNLFGL